MTISSFHRTVHLCTLVRWGTHNKKRGIPHFNCAVWQGSIRYLYVKVLWLQKFDLLSLLAKQNNFSALCAVCPGTLSTSLYLLSPCLINAIYCVSYKLKVIMTELGIFLNSKSGLMQPLYIQTLSFIGFHSYFFFSHIPLIFKSSYLIVFLP